MNISYIKIIPFLFAATLTGCLNNSSSNNVGATANNINLQMVLNDAINSPDAKNAYVTGIPLTFQCNGFNNNQAVSLSAGKINLNADAPDLPVDAIYQIGSSTKSFVAVVALQLEAEGYFGKNGLDSTVGDILGNPDSSTSWNVSWNNSTLRQLLNMTSGIPDCINAVVPIYSTKPDYKFTSDELLQLVANKNLNFEPGQGWQYSNTNYVIMNKIISYVTNSNINVQVTRRIINKLGLTHTYYVDNLPIDAITNPMQKTLLMSGYFGSKELGVFNFTTDLSLYSLSWANAAGSIISSTIDMNKYVHALFAYKNGLLTPTQLNELTYMVATENSSMYKAGQHIPVIDKAAKGPYGLGYGLGIMEFFKQLPNGHSITYYSHGGSTIAFSSNWIYSPQKQVFATYVFNSQSPNRQIHSAVESKIYEKIDTDCIPNYILKSN
jgi:D-alanyl-D-alanine carboxypeptidase